MAKMKIIVTTTPNIEGWEIESYLGPISAHIVAGTGFFSDFAAGFSDIFGGRSQTYQKQLGAINNEVIETLKNKASLLGANFIVGLRIDHDEISGKSKQMFMVTAYGTAVRALQSKTSKPTSEKKTILVSSEELSTSLRIKEIIQKCQSMPIFFSEEERNFVIENQVHQIASNILESLQIEYERNQNSGTDTKTDFERRYFLSLPKDIAIEHLYDAVIKYELLLPFICETIFQGDLFDYPSISKIFSINQFEIRSRGLQLAQADKPFYVPDDISILSHLIEDIKTVFAIRAKYVEEKSKLTSNIKHKWLCDCGAKNDKDDIWCGKCSRDIYGFKDSEPTPEKVIQVLDSKISTLKMLFS